jgi:hypothetical protein
MVTDASDVLSLLDNGYLKSVPLFTPSGRIMRRGNEVLGT